MRKRGQFFLLAAVIISAVIITLGVGLNKVVVSEEPGEFYDFSYEVKREVGAFLDYEVYSDFDDGTDLNDFVDKLAEEAEERSPGSDFILIYGSGGSASDWTVRNYGSESVYVGSEEIEGLDEGDSRICFKEMCQDIDEELVDFNIFNQGVDIDLARLSEGAEDILVEIGGYDFEFPLSNHRQVIFVMLKEVDGDRHVIVE